MMLELLAAATVGITFGNSWICALLGFGATTATETRRVGSMFIIGRVFGLVGLGLAIALLGITLSTIKDELVIAFAVLSIAFGIFMLFMFRKEGCVFERFHIVKRCAESNDDGCTSCGSCSGCGEKEVKRDRKATSGYAMALGAFRGATPCFKLGVLAPLLVSVELHVSVAIMLVYALASSVYPVIGFLSARLFMNMRTGLPVVRVAGAAMLIAIGIYSIVMLMFPEQCSLE